MKPTKPSVFIVDDDPSMREALSSLLRSTGRPVQTFESASAFLEYQRPDCPCCLILDMRMSGMSGPELQQHLLAISDLIPIIFISAHGDIPSAVRAVKAGALEFLPKPFEEQALLDAVAQALARDAQRRSSDEFHMGLQARFDRLTTREHEVMNFAVKGMLNKQIGSLLGIAEVTVKVHRHNIMQKMDVRSLPDLIQLINDSKTYRS